MDTCLTKLLNLHDAITLNSTAATVAEYGSKIYVISDAVPRSDVTIRYIQALQSQKDLTISFLLTGQCKQKRSIGT